MTVRNDQKFETENEPSKNRKTKLQITSHANTKS